IHVEERGRSRNHITLGKNAVDYLAKFAQNRGRGASPKTHCQFHDSDNDFRSNNGEKVKLKKT
ncbi:hypothetical protein CCACVL1_06172, partial [Corchorus capsularis]